MIHRMHVPVEASNVRSVEPASNDVIVVIIIITQQQQQQQLIFASHTHIHTHTRDTENVYRSDGPVLDYSFRFVQSAGEVERIASEEVVLHLVITKCIPILLYGLEVYPFTKAELHSLDFAVTRFLTKLFNTSSISVIKDCCRSFSFKLPSELLERRFKKFTSKRSF